MGGGPVTAQEVNAIVFTADGNAEVLYLDPHWEALRDRIGGWLEGLSPVDVGAQFGPWRGYCDEEGKVKGLPVNHAATHLLGEMGWYGAGADVLVGTVVLIGEGKGREAADVPDATLKHVLDFYREHGEVAL